MMSYQLRRKETLGENLRRICGKEVAQALRLARGEVEPEGSPVHETRKHLKKARAALQLVADQIGRGHYKKQSHGFRDVGRLISDERDAEVRLQTVRELQEILRRASPFPKTEALLLAELEHFVAAFAGWQRQAAPQLEKLLAEVENWRVDELDCKQTRCAVQRAYKAARDALACARENSKPENFHNFRSKAKRLFYQLRILRPINPPVIDALADELKGIADVFGRSHDLHFLGARLRRDDAEPRESRELVTLIDASETDLQQRGLDLAERFFSERPRDFGNGLGLWLEQWVNGEAPMLADALVCDAKVLQ